MKKKIICYFENEKQCEAAVTALKNAGIEENAIRILSESTQKTGARKNPVATRIGPAATLAMPDNYTTAADSPETTYAQAPIATLLIRGDLFAFEDDADIDVNAHAVEVYANQETLDMARDILFNQF